MGEDCKFLDQGTSGGAGFGPLPRPLTTHRASAEAMSGPHGGAGAQAENSRLSGQGLFRELLRF